MVGQPRVVITEEGAMGVQSREEVKDILFHHFGIRKHECYVYRSFSEPFIAMFPDSHDRDVVFAAGRVADGPVGLAFHEWDIDKFGDRVNIPYLVWLSLEGLPRHAWGKEIADKILCDEAVIHYVETDTAEKTDQRAYCCWAYTRTLQESLKWCI
jgi:hypothetical protein